jgi:hypothetical protein
VERCSGSPGPYNRHPIRTEHNLTPTQLLSKFHANNKVVAVTADQIQEYTDQVHEDANDAEDEQEGGVPQVVLLSKRSPFATVEDQAEFCRRVLPLSRSENDYLVFVARIAEAFFVLRDYI